MPDLYIPVHPGQSARLGSLEGVRIREDVLCTNHKGEDKEGERKRAEKMIRGLGEILHRLLEPEEAVFYLAPAQAPVSAFEQLTLGWYLYAVTRVALVLTNRRLLVLSVEEKGFLFGKSLRWKRGLRSVGWGDIEEAKVKGWLNRALHLKLRDGSKTNYWRLSRRDAKKIKLLLDAMSSAGTEPATPAPGMVFLCPNCLAGLTPKVYACGQCGLEFKNEKTMMRRSLLIPGGGYFYVGLKGLGVGDFLVESYLLVLVGISLLYALGVWVDVPEPGETPFTQGAWWFTLGFLVVILAIEKVLTIHHCRRFVREFIPAR